MKTFLEWIDDYLKQFENVEMPNTSHLTDYETGYKFGCYDTQNKILVDLCFAVEVEKKKKINS